MNETEKRYGLILEQRKLLGEIQEYYYEGLKFRLADKTFYTPDFIVVKGDQIECHEIKGYWEDDARVKIKVAAVMYWQFLFMAITYKKGAPTKGRSDEWITEVF
jgi:hypothetical protein